MDKLGRLKRVDLREIWDTEAQHFTPWLAAEENLSILAETLGMELELDAQEANVGPFRADILCRNSDGGSYVLIENQLERTDHGHLGQLLTYAAGLHAVTICWVAERFTEEHRATLDWLNEITGDQFQFFGLEVEVWRIGDSDPAPKFNMVARPNDWSRSVAPPKEMTPKRRLQQEFWAALMKHLEERGSGVRRKKPQPENWMYFSVGRAEFWLETTLQSAEKWIGVALFMSGPDATAHWALLERRRAEIERELGVLEWRALPDKKSSSIRLRLNDTDPLQEKDWPTQLDWMASTLERFDKTFRPRVKSLDASEWRPDGDVT
ncbi:MAG: DUF4268 domain-containing protein [Acidobacteria bacterium]|nr:DUF4268 domain-containing protein [Acidobacteriota bacterium]